MRRMPLFLVKRRGIFASMMMVGAVSAFANQEEPPPSPGEGSTGTERTETRTDIVGRAAQAASPSTPAIKNITSFTPALRCMDELFVGFHKRGIVITSGGLPDETAKVRTGSKEMLISAISKMSVRSGAFSFIDFHRTMGSQDDLGHLFEMKGSERTMLPDYYIRGSITQMDDNTIRKSKGFGFALPFMDFSLANDVAYDLLSIDMSVVEAASRKILPETSVANTMVIVKGGNSADGGGKIGKAGIQLSIDFSKTEGLGAATRALVELSLIEALGKFTQVPYWKCLNIDSGNPAMKETALEWFETSSDINRNIFVQRKLAGMNRYTGPIDGKPSDAFNKSISEYQAKVGLIANGIINFDVYFSLLDDTQNALAALPTSAAAQLPSGVSTTLKPPPTVESMLQGQATEHPAEDRLQLSISTDRGAQPIYKIGETLQAHLTPTKSAISYCYYEDSANNISRIFPNKFTPNTIIPGNKKHLIAQYGFKIRFDRPGSERIACIASDKIIKIPESLSGYQDFQKIPNFSMDRILLEYSKSNSDSRNASLRITVIE